MELQGPIGRGARRAAEGVLPWCPAVASRSSPKGGREQSWNCWEEIGSGLSLRTSSPQRGERWQAELDPNKCQSQHWDSLACREADPWRCWHCIRTLWTKLSREDLHSSNWNSLLLQWKESCRRDGKWWILSFYLEPTIGLLVLYRERSAHQVHLKFSQALQ